MAGEVRRVADGGWWTGKHTAPAALGAGGAVVADRPLLRGAGRCSGGRRPSVMDSMDRMNEYARNLVQGEREELFSINYWLVCQAPL